MKSLVSIVMLLSSFSSFSRVDYGDNNKDMTKIIVLEDSLQKCEQQLAKVHELVLSRNKAQTKVIPCVEVSIKHLDMFISINIYKEFL